MNDEIKVSVIIPIYNSENFIQRSMNSVINQTLKDIEIICIDDASNDHSLAILEDLKKRDHRIVIIPHENNQGAAVSRNDGLAIAKGEYVIFLDSDDFFYEDMLETAYNQAKIHKADVVIFGSEQSSASEKGCKKSYPLPESTQLQYHVINSTEEKSIYLYRTRHVPWDKMVRKELLYENNIHFQNLPANNDIFFSFAVIASARKIVLCNRIFVHYYWGREGSLTRTRITTRNYMVEAFKQTYQYMHMRNINSDIMIAFLNIMLDNVQKALSDKNNSIHVREIIKREMTDFYGYIEEIKDYSNTIFLHPHNRIFLKKILSNEDVINTEYIQYYEEGIKSIIIPRKERGMGIAVWGCGKRGKELLDLISGWGMKVDYVIDEKNSGREEWYKEYPIFSFEQVKDKIETVLITNLIYLEEIQQKARGKEVIYVWK